MFQADSREEKTVSNLSALPIPRVSEQHIAETVSNLLSEMVGRVTPEEPSKLIRDFEELHFSWKDIKRECSSCEATVLELRIYTRLMSLRSDFSV